MEIRTFDDCVEASKRIHGYCDTSTVETLIKIHGIEHPLSVKLKLATCNDDRWAVVREAQEQCRWEIRDRALHEIVCHANGSDEAWATFKYCGADWRLADTLLTEMLKKGNTKEEIKKIFYESERYAAELNSTREALRQLCEMI